MCGWPLSANTPPELPPGCRIYTHLQDAIASKLCARQCMSHLRAIWFCRGPMKSFSAARCTALLCCLAIAAHVSGQDMASPAHFLADFEKRVTVKVLPNGLTLIVCERPEAPVFSYFTIVDAGDANDPGGESGPRAHVRAPGLQGHQRYRHDRLSRRKRLRSIRWKRPTRPTMTSSASA